MNKILKNLFLIVVIYGNDVIGTSNRNSMAPGNGLVSQQQVLSDQNIVMVQPEDYPKLYKQWYFVRWVMDTIEHLNYKVEILNFMDDDMRISPYYTLEKHHDFDFWWGVSDVEIKYNQNIKKQNQQNIRENIERYTIEAINEKITLIFPKINCALLLKITDEKGRAVNNHRCIFHLKNKIQNSVEGKYRKILYITLGIIGGVMGILLYFKMYKNNLKKNLPLKTIPLSNKNLMVNIFWGGLGGLIGTFLAYKIF
jgi:hypothetical protein